MTALGFLVRARRSEAQSPQPPFAAPAVPQPLEALRVGMQREFLVVQPEDENGQVVLSLGAIEVRTHEQSAHQPG